MKKTAWVAGASGLIGSHLMELLCQHPSYEKVVAFVRKPVEADWAQHPKVEQWCVDYSALRTQHDGTVDDVFCALGSTTKKTPNKQAYYEIDVTYPLKVAELGLNNGAKFYGLVSAQGAKPKAFSYYFKMKGQLEESLKTLDYPHTTFARPSLLIGDRKEFRPAEKISESLMSLLPGDYKAIHAIDVAAALVLAAEKPQQHLEILSSGLMQNVSKFLQHKH